MQGIIRKYKSYLPLVDEDCIVSLDEGNTPLVRLGHIEKQFNFQGEIYAKFEGANPTGSFKDRGMTLAVSHALAEGKKAVICASTGNTSAAAAAYAAKAGLKAFVVIPEGKIAMGKLIQACIHGAKVIQIKGNFDEGLSIVKQIAENDTIELVNSLNPYRIAGQRTAAYEIVDALGRAPDYHVLPIGNGGNTTAYWQGYEIYRKAGKQQQSPKMISCQAEHAAPFVEGHFIENPETIATAIRIGKPAYWQQSNQAIIDSGGKFLACTDCEILNAQQLLAAKEGLFCEPASAASIVGLEKLILEHKVPSHSVIVCTLTGHGLKDTALVQETMSLSIETVDAEFSQVASVINLAS